MPNKLQGMRTYLVGAMDRVPDGGVGWRNKSHLLSLNIRVIDPCDKPISLQKKAQTLGLL